MFEDIRPTPDRIVIQTDAPIVAAEMTIEELENKWATYYYDYEDIDREEVKLSETNNGHKVYWGSIENWAKSLVEEKVMIWYWLSDCLREHTYREPEIQFKNVDINYTDEGQSLLISSSDNQ